MHSARATYSQQDGSLNVAPDGWVGESSCCWLCLIQSKFGLLKLSFESINQSERGTMLCINNEQGSSRI